MNYDDEPFIKVHTRDTVRWKRLQWEGRCLLLLLQRKVDRAGCLDLEGNGEAGVAAIAEVPLDIAHKGLAQLLEVGEAVVSNDVLTLVHFHDAQSSRMSDKLRQQRSREKRRLDAMAGAQHPTAAPAPAQPPPDASRIVTERHDSHDRVTENHEPSAVRDQTSQTGTTRRDETRGRSEETRSEGIAPAPARAPAPRAVDPEIEDQTPLFREFKERAGSKLGIGRPLAHTAMGMPQCESDLFVHAWIQALRSGYTAKDLLRFADWIAAGGLGFWRGAGYSYLAKKLIEGLDSAKLWEDGGRPLLDSKTGREQRTDTRKRAPAEHADATTKKTLKEM